MSGPEIKPDLEGGKAFCSTWDCPQHTDYHVCEAGQDECAVYYREQVEFQKLMLTMMAAQIRKNRLQVFDRPDAYKHMKDVKTAEEIVEEFRKKAEDERDFATKA